MISLNRLFCVAVSMRVSLLCLVDPSIHGVGTKFDNAHELGTQGSPLALKSPLVGIITFRLMER